MKRFRTTGDVRAHARGQSLVEFALVLTPLLMILLGILQMGIVLNAYVTISNAAREGARAATIYVYDRSLSKAQNDYWRAEAARTALTTAMGALSRSAPAFSTSSSWTSSGSTFTNGDLTVTYSLPAGTSETDARTGQYVAVNMTYHLDIVIPLIGNLLPKDANGRLPMGAQATMVVN